MFLIALIIGLAILLRRAKAKKAGLPLAPIRREPPHVTAINSLNAIEAKNMIGQGLIKEYYIEISEVVRRYVGERFTVVTMERTTDEILSDLIQVRVHRDYTESILTFLRDADMVKFAKRRPDRQVCGEDMLRARKIIESTMEATEKDAVLQ